MLHAACNIGTWGNTGRHPRISVSAAGRTLARSPLTLGHHGTGLKVSRLALGPVNFGELSAGTSFAGEGRFDCALPRAARSRLPVAVVSVRKAVLSFLHGVEEVQRTPR
jgi:hypothetical protein